MQQPLTHNQMGNESQACLAALTCAASYVVLAALALNAHLEHHAPRMPSHHTVPTNAARNTSAQM